VSQETPFTALAWKSLSVASSAIDGGDMKYLRLGPMVVLGALSTSCASTPPPHEKAASSEAAVRTAEEVGARDVPQAGQYLDLAQKELDQGKALMRSGNNHDASLMFQKAQADAELALGLARENRTRVAAEQTKARAQALRQSIPGAAVGGGPVPSAPPVPRTPPPPVQPGGAPLTPPAQPPAQPPPQPKK
jgi:hypothetical protein